MPTVTQALWLLPFCLPIAIWVSYTDLKYMKIRNNACLAMIAVWAVLGWPAVGMNYWLWGFAIMAIVLVLGFLVPLVGLLLVAANVALIAWTQRGWQWRVTEGGWEYQVVLAAFGLVLLAFGGGRAGMDAMFRRRGDDPDRKVVREHP